MLHVYLLRHLVFEIHVTCYQMLNYEGLRVGYVGRVQLLPDNFHVLS
jgi:hypothetical protein